jgi:S-adenosylmethionine:tRNA ribosyltransferase-isomerase
VKLAEFDYDLPPGRIAQRPLENRDASRLLVLDRDSGTMDHRRFREFPGLLAPGDLLVLNDTRVLPARLVGRKPSGGRVELLLLERTGDDPGDPTWRCWLKASRKPELGSELHFDHGLVATVLARDEKVWSVRLGGRGGPVGELLRRAGRMPLPPYISRPDGEPAPVDDRTRYQTVYARRDGAVAAPTAGLHFTPEVLKRIADRGVGQARVTLHVGPGTFEPVQVREVERHRMHAERFEIPRSTAEAIARTRNAGGRVVAVGTTVVRALEHCATEDGSVRADSGWCDLFIYPGYRFRAVDAMLTNFHLPRTTLIMLVSAFAGRERVLRAYREAVRNDYRFYSYGDAMFVGRLS